jgi:hypothetical protein
VASSQKVFIDRIIELTPNKGVLSPCMHQFFSRMGSSLKRARIIASLCGGWWSAMSGATSIPLAFAALYWTGTPRRWFAVLAFLGLLVFAFQILKRNYHMGEAAKLYQDNQSIIVDLHKQLEPYLRNSKPVTPQPMSIALRDNSQIKQNVGHFAIEVRNNTTAAIRNVKVELLSIYPTPSGFSTLGFPINLSPKDKTRTINPQTADYFDLIKIEVGPGKRTVIIRDDTGAIKSFEEDLFQMLSILKRNGYTLKLVVSSSDLPKVGKNCRLILSAESGDLMGLPGLFGYSVSLAGC